MEGRETILGTRICPQRFACAIEVSIGMVSAHLAVLCCCRKLEQQLAENCAEFKTVEDHAAGGNMEELVSCPRCVLID